MVNVCLWCLGWQVSAWTFTCFLFWEVGFMRIDSYISVALRPAALASLRRFVNAYGSSFEHVTSSYRDPSRQVQLFLERYKPQSTGSGKFGDVKVYNGKRFVRVSGLGTVAVPGTSEHERGLAIDVAEPLRGLLHRHGSGFGWVNPSWAKSKNFFEPWHFEYRGYLDTTSKGDWLKMASKEELRQVFMEVLGSTDIAGAVWNRDLGGESKPDDITWYILKDTQNQVRALTAEVKRLNEVINRIV